MTPIRQHCVIGAIVEHKQEMQKRDKAIVVGAAIIGVLIPIVIHIVL